MSWILGLAGSAGIAVLAYKRGSLTKSGSIATIGVGTALFGLVSFAWYVILLLFFLTSSALSHVFPNNKKQAEVFYQKSGRRDAGQVWANGGIALLSAIAYAITQQEWWWFSFLGAMATVTADTWATELGTLSRGNPRSIRTGKRVPRGTSGGVSGLGFAASFAGSSLIAATAVTLGAWDSTIQLGRDSISVWVATIVAGMIGSIADSWMGAVVQVRYRCHVCGIVSEKATHCGTNGIVSGGWSMFDNDAVNFISSLIGAVVAVAVYFMFL